MSTPLQDAVEKWELKYQKTPNVFGDDPSYFLENQFHLFQSVENPVLVPGDGDGRNGVWLARQGFQIHANDGAPTGVKNAQKRAALHKMEHRYQTRVQDLRHWQPEAETYGAIVNMHVHFIEEERTVFNEKLFYALKPGGLLIIELFHPDQLVKGTGGPRALEICARPEDLQSDFSEMDIQLCGCYENPIKPTFFHDGGHGFMTRLVAYKKSANTSQVP